MSVTVVKWEPHEQDGSEGHAMHFTVEGEKYGGFLPDPLEPIDEWFALRRACTLVAALGLDPVIEGWGDGAGVSGEPQKVEVVQAAHRAARGRRRDEYREDAERMLAGEVL